MVLLGVLSNFFENPSLLIWIIPALIILFLLINMNFSKLSRDEYYKRKKAKKWFFLSRMFIYIFLIMSLATPFLTDTLLGRGDSSLVLLIDNSTSFSLYNEQTVSSLEETLSEYTDVRTVHFGDNEQTPLTDTLLDNLEQDGHVLVISDGQNNYGADLREALLQATTINGTINTLRLEPTVGDSAIIIVGPDKVSPGVLTQFTAKVSSTEKGKTHQISVTIDGATIIDESTTQTSIDFSHTFEEGDHEMVATLAGKDHFKENNKYYKTVRVIDKPNVLFYSANPSPLVGLLNQLYDVDETTDLAAIDKNRHYAVIVNNAPASVLDENFPLLNDYLAEDNGLLIIGGEGAYDKGNYEGSRIEDLLPVISAVAEEEDEGIVNIVISLDISKSSAPGFGQGIVTDVEKAIALSVIDNLKETHSVGVIAFNTDAYVVQPLTPLKGNRDLIKNKIASLKKDGSSYIPPGIESAIAMINAAGGAKNILLISDGKTGGMGEAKTLAAKIKESGITLYGVGIGDPCIKYNPRTGDCDEWSDTMYGVNAMKDIAVKAGGVYFYGEETPQRVKVIFGDPNGGGSQESFTVVVVDDTHFISQGLDVRGKITGFNNVIPKKTAHYIVGTDTREPLIVTWRYGVGRVASLATDDGSLWAGKLLSGEDSLFYAKTINWLIGDPEKKSTKFVYIPDTNIGRSTDVLVKDSEKPEAEGLTFYKKEDGLYSATLTPTSTGFNTALGRTFAVNYNKELESLGTNNQLESMVLTTGGRAYTSSEVNEIIAQVSTHSTRPESSALYYDWVLVLLVLLLFLLEITVRRIREHKSI